MKKIKVIYIIMLIWIWLLLTAFSFNINIFGYEISYNSPPEQQIINNNKQYTRVSEQTNPQTHKFDNEIDFLNNIKETQFYLKNLNYNSIGVINTDTNEQYTIIINNGGIIEAVYEGLYNPEVIISSSFTQIKEDINHNDFNAIKQHINIPLKVKLKLLFMRWF